jgi:hypothetical protein
MLEEFRLLPQRVRVSLASSCVASVAAARGMGGALLPLLVVISICQVYPKATIIAQNPPHFIENAEEVTHEIIRMQFVA